jgi:hypothetical protein
MQSVSIYGILKPVNGNSAISRHLSRIRAGLSRKYENACPEVVEPVETPKGEDMKICDNVLVCSCAN